MRSTTFPRSHRRTLFAIAAILVGGLAPAPGAADATTSAPLQIWRTVTGRGGI